MANVGKYTIHGSSGYDPSGLRMKFSPRSWSPLYFCESPHISGQYLIPNLYPKQPGAIYFILRLPRHFLSGQISIIPKLRLMVILREISLAKPPFKGDQLVALVAIICPNILITFPSLVTFICYVNLLPKTTYPQKKNHLLRMVMEPKYLEEVIVHPNHLTT